MLPAYAELHCRSNFSFLSGASQPEELVLRAQALGYVALAITDVCSLAGIVRAHLAARDAGLPLIVGSEFELGCGLRLVLLATDRASYGNLCQLVTRGRRQATKGDYAVGRDDVAAFADGLLALWVPPDRPLRAPPDPDAALVEAGRWVAATFPRRSWLAVELFAGAGDRFRLARSAALARSCGLPQVAAGDVHMHVRSRRALQDTLTAIRLGTPLAECGYALFPNGERHLRSRERLACVYPSELLEATLAVAARCRFSLAELRYEYPEEIVPPGTTPAAHLAALVEAGLRQRYPAQGAPDAVRALIAHELSLIAELGYEPYFLTVHDIVAFARGRGILCQGRGSAANSAVCYALGITEVDPARSSMLFERFISRERNEPPDIDVDFEHQRREEVIQYIYAKYGRDRAALAATLITYRPKSAVRDVGKALGLDLAQVDRLTRAFAWWDGRHVLAERIREAGFEPDNPVLVRLVKLANALLGFPRHLSQHVGGFVIARDLIERMVPVENAAMPERTVIQWDKDDLDAMGLLKVDCLALGMLSAIRRALALIGQRRGRPLSMQDIPAEDAEVYGMIQAADTVGVFQIESRAQQSMLPRLQARVLLRPRHRGRDRAPGADPGRHGASLPTPPAGAGAGHLSERCGGERARAHARRADLPGAGDAARHRRRRLHARARPTSCGARWPRGAGRAGSRSSSSGWSTAWRRAGCPRPSRGRSTSRSWASASTAFPSRIRRRSRCSSTFRRGSSATSRRRSARRCSIRCRWASTRRRSSSPTRAAMASRCAPPT